MTQAVVGVDAVAAAVAASALANAEEATMAELEALVGDPIAEPVAAPTEATTTTEGAEDKPAAVTEEPAAQVAEVDAALERAKVAAAKAREGSRRYAAMQEQQREAQAAVQRAAREAEQLRQENAAARAREEGFKKDPYKALKDAGMTDRDLAERALRENTPEAAVVRLQEQVEAERAARVALETKLEQQAEAARRAQIVAKAEQEFAATADNEAAYPELSRMTTEGQLSIARLALQRIERNGHSTARLSTAQIAEAAEKFIALTRKPGKTTAAAPVVAPTQKSKPSGATLTNKQAQTRTVAPAEWDSLSDEAQMAAIAAALPDPT